MIRRINFNFSLLLSIGLVGSIVLLFSDNFLTIYNGFIAIQLHPSLLVSDYLAIGGLSASLLNAWLLSSLSVLILSKHKVQFTGLSFAGVLTIVGFAFFGKNLLNVIPIWFGFYLFTLYKKTPLKSYTGTFLFASGIAPVTSFIAFGIPQLSLFLSIPLGLLSGVLTGFLTPMVVAIVGKFHQGYNLYNTGFGIGFIAIIITGILRSFQVDVSVPFLVSYSFHSFFVGFFLIFSVLLIVVSFLLDRRPWYAFLRLIQSPGNLPSDFVKDFGLSATLLNTGLLSFFSLCVVWLFNYQISGPMVAAIFTVIGFGGYGKHLRNIMPVMFGLYLATLVTPYFNIADFGPSISIFFVTALAPIAGKFGFFYGALAGFMHLLIASQALAIQGGFDLYNNGFTAGIVAGFVVAIAQNVVINLRLPNFKKVRH
jgi:hypothetical protein